MNSRRIGILVSAVGMALALVALLAPAAFGDTPKKGYERFAGCPSLKENEEIFLCERVVINGGHFQMGNKDVPLKNPITLSGGIDVGGKVYANSKGGLTPVKQTVPGGIIGLTGLDWLVEFLGLEDLQLFATTEIAGQPFIKKGGKISELPIRVHLENPVLGSKCYVGSFTEPIKLVLNTGTTSPPEPNKPITGAVPVPLKESDLEEVLLLEDGVYVDNSFAAPGANGCVLTIGFIPISINGLVNSTSGLPAKAGTNETKQNFDVEIVSPESVYP